MTRLEATARRPDRVMAAEIVTLPDGERVRFVQRGSGRDVLLLHGTLVLLEDMMLALEGSLAPHFRITAIDRPGHGLSTRPRLRGTMQDQTGAIRAVIEALGLHRPLVVGHSAGASVAVSLALDHPAALGGVVSLAPVVLPEWRLEQILFGPRATPGLGDALAWGAGRAIDAATVPVLWNTMFLPQAMPPAFAAAFPFALAGKAADLLATGEEAVQQAGGYFANFARYAFNTVPTVVMTGSADVVVNPVHGAALSLMLARSRHRPIAGLGHMIHHFAQDEVLRALQDLATSAPGPG